MARIQLKPSTVKKLFGLSGNLCAFPDCREHLIDSVGNVLGEICHIEAAEVGGERFNAASTDEFRRSFENLLLMCSKHHKITNDVSKYSVTVLKGYKKKHENKSTGKNFAVEDKTVDRAIDKYTEQNNINSGSGIQFNNQGTAQTIQNQIGVQKNYFTAHDSSAKIAGARPANKTFKDIIDQFKQKASPPSTEVIDFRNELKDRFERTVEIIPTKHLRFRKNNGRIIAEVESYEMENGVALNEVDDSTQEILRQFLINNDKEKNEELKRLLSQKGQQRPAIITCDGFLINGNRRKMALEELFKTRNQDSQFEMMRVVILPDGVTELEIQKIENRYQLQSEGKSEYQGISRAIKYQRNIENGFSLEAQLRDDPNYYELPPKEFEKVVREFKKNFLQPLECANSYLDTFGRKGMYKTISEGVNDSEGRWQAFIDYSNFLSGTLKNTQKLTQLKIKENEVGKIENAVFKIIRKRTLNVQGTEIGKVHEFVRKLPKYLANDDAKKFILKISEEVPEDLPENMKYDKDGDKLSERDIDEKWGANFREQILGNLMKAHRHLSNQEERDKPLELLEDALKKLKHDHLKIENMGAEYYDKALDLANGIIEQASIIHKAIDDARYKKKKLNKKVS